MVYLTIKELRTQKRNKLDWKGICDEMAIKQKNGDIVYHSDFSIAKSNTIQHAFAKMKKMYETENSKD